MRTKAGWRGTAQRFQALTTRCVSFVCVVGKDFSRILHQLPGRSRRLCFHRVELSQSGTMKGMFSISVETAEITRPLSNGATRVRFRAMDEEDKPAAIFLCCVEPPNAFERILRESYITVCSVEDLAEYPVGVSAIEEVDPAEFPADTFLYVAYENKVYVRSADETGQPVWTIYAPVAGKRPNVHTHKLPFFRRSAIDIILPNRSFVLEAVEWIEEAAKRLTKDMQDIEKLKPIEP